MSSKQLNIVLGVAVVVLLGIVGYMALRDNTQNDTLNQQNTTPNSNLLDNNTKTAQPTNNTNTPQPAGNTIPTDEISSWKTYTNTAYGFEVKYPSNWYFVAEKFNNADGFFISKNTEGPGSQLAILPKGEFDYGLPFSEPSVSNQTISGKRAQVRKWQLEGGKTLTIYNFTDPIANWIKCGSDLKNCNRLDMQADNTTDLTTLQKVVSTFKLTK